MDDCIGLKFLRRWHDANFRGRNHETIALWSDTSHLQTLVVSNKDIKEATEIEETNLRS